jgi:3-methyladenine DNA glycosylase AlkC
MAEILKNRISQSQIEQIAEALWIQDSHFNKESFNKACLLGLEFLELKERANHIAEQMDIHLDGDYNSKIEVMIRSLGAKLSSSESFGYEPFLYFPHSSFIAKWGVQNIQASLKACEELTQRFTAEFCIRPLIVADSDLVYSQLKIWSLSPNEHLRRLVSEGTRPRLPWGMGLKSLQADPTPNLILLEELKNDSSLYVRRSVANHLNDIGKDHPELQLDICENWMKNPTDNVKWIVKHSLRVLIKKAHPRALALVGFGGKAFVKLEKCVWSHDVIDQSQKLLIKFELQNLADSQANWLVDYWVDYIKSNQKVSRKVFKYKKLFIESQERAQFELSHSFRDLSTRKHYAGTHKMGLSVNGVEIELGNVDLMIQQ